MNLVVEPAAATGVAALLDGQVRGPGDDSVCVAEGPRPLSTTPMESSSPPRGQLPPRADAAPRNVGVVLCGGNIDIDAPLPWRNGA